MCALIWLVSAALGADPVVHDGVSGEAVARVSAASGRATDAFQAIAWDDLRARPPAVVGEGAVTPCSGPTSTNEQLQWLVQRADGAVAYGENDRASTELAEAGRVLGCLVAPVDAERLVRLRMLEGVVAAGQGREDAALAAFRGAIGVGKVAWDDAWPASARALFDRAAGEAAQGAKARLTVVAPGAVVHVDGKPAEGPIEVVPGAHVVLVGGATPVPMLVEVREGAVQVVVPSAFPADLAVADAPGARGPHAALLAATLGEGTSVFVVTEGAVWAASAGRTDWIALSTHRTSPLHGVGKVVAGVGAAALIGGGIPAAMGWSQATSASQRMTDAESSEAFTAAKADWQDGADLLRPTRWVAVGGGALGVLGLGLAIATAPEKLPVAPMVMADGFGVAFQVRR